MKLPLKEPFRLSCGEVNEQIAIVVKAQSEGAIGWGDASPFWAPIYGPEFSSSVYQILKDFLLPAVMGKEFLNPQELLSALSFVRGNQFAKSALEIAFWNLIAHAQGKPLHKLMGGVREKVTVGAPIGIQRSVPKLLQDIEGFLKQRYHRIKLKIQAGWDVEMVREVRKAFPNINLMVDANGAYTLADAAHLKQLDEFHLMFIEQPLEVDDLLDHAKLQGMIKTPIALDESIHSPADVRRAIELQSCRIVNIKVGRVGGLANAIAVHDLCQQAGWPVWVGGMMDMGIGSAVKIEFASLSNVTLPGDIAPSERRYHEDIVEPPIKLNEDGTYDVSSGPGIGRQVKESFIRAHAIGSFRLTA